MAKEVCIVCGQEKTGYPVEDDVVLSTLRAIKQRLGISTGNKLVVCKEDVEKAKEKRARFEKYLMWYGILAAAAFFIVLFSSSSLFVLLWAPIAALFVMLLALTMYYPKVILPKSDEAEKEKKANEEKVKAGKKKKR